MLIWEFKPYPRRPVAAISFNVQLTDSKRGLQKEMFRNGNPRFRVPVIFAAFQVSEVAVNIW